MRAFSANVAPSRPSGNSATSSRPTGSIPTIPSDSSTRRNSASFLAFRMATSSRTITIYSPRADTPGGVGSTP